MDEANDLINFLKSSRISHPENHIKRKNSDEKMELLDDNEQ